MGTLYVVATPIGNLEDWSHRAERVMREVSRIYAEDTRRTRVLLDRYAIDGRPRALHAHNERARTDEILAALGADEDVALVSDAGTPLISDPGARIVEAAAEGGYRVEAIPGASAVLAALAVSGIAPQPFVFVGFLPRKAGARARLLASYVDRPETLVVFESPQRVAATLGELAEHYGERQGCVARELTKLHEEVVRGSLRELSERFADGTRGEVTLVIAGAPERAAFDASDPAAEEALVQRIDGMLGEGLRAKEIAAALAEETGLPKRDLYARTVARTERSAD